MDSTGVGIAHVGCKVHLNGIWTSLSRPFIRQLSSTSPPALSIILKVTALPRQKHFSKFVACASFLYLISFVFTGQLQFNKWYPIVYIAFLVRR